MKKTFIIAEIGINHEGNLKKCLWLIKKAKDAGADAVKLQTIDPEKNYVKNTISFNLFKKATLTQNETAIAFKYAKKIGIKIFTTCGDIETVKWINKLKPWGWKISSSLITHLPLISFISKLKKNIIISTGLANLNEINAAVKKIRANKNYKITILQCTSNYPTKLEDINLRKILSLKEKFNCNVGFSDHSIGDQAAFLSIALGASMIEKHFTFDKARKNFDHKISLEPREFKNMVMKIRIAEKILGSSSFELKKNITSFRNTYLRTIVAKKNINKGFKFSTENLTIKRGSGSKIFFSPDDLNKIIGKKSLKFIKKDTTINKNHLI